VARAGLSAEVDEVRPDDIAQFFANDVALVRPDGRRKRPQSVNVLRSSLKGFFRYAHDIGVSNTNPTALLRRARCSGGPPRALSRDDCARLFVAFNDARTPADQRDLVLVRLLLATGLRLGSALGLDVEDVDLEAREMSVRNCKGARDERVALGGSVRDVLAEYLDGRVTGPLFASHAGDRLPVRQAQRRLGKWFGAAGVRASAHALRHTFATRLYEATHDPLLVKAALHHRSIGSTMVYATATTDQVRSAVERVDFASQVG
jgi:site-specific recombinase XerD